MGDQSVSHRRRAVAAVSAAFLLLGAPAAAQEGPIVGTPPVEDAIAGWGETYADPDFWSSWVSDAFDDGHFNLPWPTDLVKPESYLPNVLVPAGGDVTELPIAIDDWSDFTYEFGGQTKTIPQFLTTTRTDVVVLVHEGTVVGEWYANGYSPDVRHQPWSVTKTFIAAVVGIAHGEGLIDSLQDPIDAYIADLAGTQWEGVTIENILQMESGVHWDEGTPVLVVNTQVEQWVDLALDLYSEGAVGQTRNEFLASLPSMGYEQGTEFRYNSGNTQVLAWLTEILYGKPFNEVLSEKLWIPMGAATDAIMTADRVGGVVASHGLFARVYDFARFGELLRHLGARPDGVKVVPADWVRAMTTMTEVSDGAYGYQTWSSHQVREGAYRASGFQGQKITVVPSSCLTGVRMAYALGADVREGDDPLDPSAYGFTDVTYSDEWQALLRAVADRFGDCPVGGQVDPTGQDGSGDSGTGSSTPTTGGGAALFGLVALGAATGAGRVRRRTRMAVR